MNKAFSFEEIVLFWSQLYLAFTALKISSSLCRLRCLLRQPHSLTPDIWTTVIEEVSIGLAQCSLAHQHI